MKKKSLIISVIVFVNLFFALAVGGIALADDEGTGIRAGLNVSADTAGLKTETTFPSAIGKVINFVFMFIGILFLIIVLYAGILWMIGGGDPGNIKKAKSYLINASIGLAVTLMAYQLTSFVIKQIQIQSAETVPVESSPTGAPPAPTPGT
ncbi:hypothetical protein KKC32_05355 [Patescibacteria group bacterium]|nr:hypothetical protein [Patescibacteria group bacterium]